MRQFLQLSEKRPQLVGKYLEKRGKPLELAEALERIDKNNIWHVSYVCDALQLVLLEIQSNKCDLMESAVYASRYFLKSHSTIIDSLLQSTSGVHKKIALKLLTVMVCVEPSVGRLILSSYPLLSSTNEINKFLSHSQHELNSNNDSVNTDNGKSYSKGEKVETVRQCYIHFVLAYLVDGNTLLIRNILDRASIIQSIIAGLMYDDATTVCVVMATLQKYVLECFEISKTKKIHVFDVNCCKSLTRLYDWRGPTGLLTSEQKNKKNDESLNAELDNFLEDPVLAKEREDVSKAVHKLLTILLTSRKHGIAFDIRKHLRYKRNNIQSMAITKFP